MADAPEEQIARALERRGFPRRRSRCGSSAARVAHRLGGQARLDAFRRARIDERHGPRCRQRIPPVVGATIRFDRPVEGPVVLGRLAHFGLGRFCAEGCDERPCQLPTGR